MSDADRADATTGTAQPPHHHGRDPVSLSRTASIHLAAHVIAAVCGYALIIALTRRLGFDDYGLYAAGSAAVLLLSLASKLGFDWAATHQIAIDRARGAHHDAAAEAWTATFWAAGLGLAGGLVLYATAPWIGPHVDPVRGAATLRAFAPIVPLANIIQVSVASLQGAHRMLLYAGLRNVAHPVALLGATGILLLLGYGLNAAILGAIAVNLVVAIAGLVALHRQFPQGRLRRPRRTSVAFGASNTGIHGMQFVYSWSGPALIALAATAKDLGLYRVAFATALMLTWLHMAFEGRFAPIASAMLAHGERDELNALIQTMSRIIFVFVSIAGAVVLFVPEVVLLPFGPNVGPAIVPLQILAVAQTFRALVGPAPYTLVAGGKPLAALAPHVGGLVILLPALVLIAARASIVTVAIVTAVAIVVRMLLQQVMMWHSLRLSVQSPGLIRGQLVFGSLVAGYVVWMGAHGAQPTAWVMLATYAAVAPFAILDRSDVRVLLETLRTFGSLAHHRGVPAKSS